MDIDSNFADRRLILRRLLRINRKKNSENPCARSFSHSRGFHFVKLTVKKTLQIIDVQTYYQETLSSAYYVDQGIFGFTEDIGLC